MGLGLSVDMWMNLGIFLVEIKNSVDPNYPPKLVPVTSVDFSFRNALRWKAYFCQKEFFG